MHYPLVSGRVFCQHAIRKTLHSTHFPYPPLMNSPDPPSSPPPPRSPKSHPIFSTLFPSSLFSLFLFFLNFPIIFLPLLPFSFFPPFSTKKTFPISFPPFSGQSDASLCNFLASFVPYEAPPTHRILRRTRHVVKENLVCFYAFSGTIRQRVLIRRKVIKKKVFTKSPN